MVENPKKYVKVVTTHIYLSKEIDDKLVRLAGAGSKSKAISKLIEDCEEISCDTDT